MVYLVIRWTCILDLYLVLQKCIIYFISTFSQGNFVVMKKGGEKDCSSRYFQFVNPYCVSTLDHRWRQSSSSWLNFMYTFFYSSWGGTINGCSHGSVSTWGNLGPRADPRPSRRATRPSGARGRALGLKAGGFLGRSRLRLRKPRLSKWTVVNTLWFISDPAQCLYYDLLFYHIWIVQCSTNLGFSLLIINSFLDTVAKLF